MLKLIRFLLGLCNHKWVEVVRGKLEDGHKQIGVVVISKCSVCGENRREDLL